MILAIDDGDVSIPTTPLEDPTMPREAAPLVTSLSLKRPVALGTENPAPSGVPSISTSAGSLAHLTSETLSRYRRAHATPVASPTTPDTASLAPPAAPLPALSTRLRRVNYDGLDALEIKVIHSSDSRLEDSVGISFNLLRDFLNPERMVDGLELLSSMGGVSSIGVFEMSIVSVAQEGTGMSPNPISTSVDPMVNSDVFNRMINASHHAQCQISHSERVLALLRFRPIMSYITLFLSLGHDVIPRSKQEHPEMFPRKINAMKFKYFLQLLALLESDAKSRRAISTLHDHLAYDRMFWNFRQELGITSLLMLALSELGLTMIAKQTGPRSLVVPEMASILSSSQGWWAFAQGTGPRVLNPLFGLGNVRYTIPQLLTFVRVEPMSAPTMHAIHLRCIERNPGTDFQLAIPQEPYLSSALSIFLGDHPIPVRYDANGNLSGKKIYIWNLAKWLVNTPDTTTVRDTNENKIPFSLFRTHLPPSEIDPALVEFYF